MNTNSKPKFLMRWLIGLLFGGVILLGLPAYADQNVTVNCASETIAAALANAAPDGRLTITLNGACTEDVTIERDQVTLKDGTVAGTGAVQPVIQILGARGIVIDNMTVQGGASHGIEATRNADVTISNNTLIQSNSGSGVRLRWGAHGDIGGGIIITGNVQCAVFASEGATVLLANSSLTTAQPDIGVCSTIAAGRNATIFLNGGNTLTNTAGGGFAMDIFQGSTLRAQNGTDTISGQVDISRSAQADIRNATITGDIAVRNRSWLRVRTPSGVTGDIFIDSDSTATFDGTPSPTINGTVTCGVSNATLVDSIAGAVTVNPSGLLAHVREGRAEGSITGGVFSNCNF